MFIIFLNFALSYSQEAKLDTLKDIEIDPRQYINVIMTL